jgi:hypothetical protein
MNREVNDQEMLSVGDRTGLELKERLIAVRKRKLATGERTPAIEAVRQRLMDEQRRERER